MAIYKALLHLALASCALADRTSRHDYQYLKRHSSSLLDEYPAHKISIPFDHFHNESRYEPHTNETFENRYWLDTRYYVEGGPVIVLAMGEDGTFDLPWLQHGLVQKLANATGGIAVMWGQRYYAGNYDPPGVDASGSYFTRYNTTNLRFMSTEQALADLAYFATHASFPGLTEKNLTAPGTPWFIVGGSYAGVISAFTRIQYPDIFWGGLSSSGVVVPIEDFWEAYDLVRRYGPPACIEIQQKVTEIFDTIMLGHNESAMTQLTGALGAKASESPYDLASRIAIPMANFQTSWVYGYSFDGPNTYCGNLTFQKIFYPDLSTEEMVAAARDIIWNGGYGSETDGLLNSVLNWFGNVRRFPSSVGAKFASPYDWLECNENLLWFTSYIPGTKGRPDALPVASRLLTFEARVQNCRDTYNFTQIWKPDLGYYKRFGGFNMSYPRLAISTGELDQWRGATPLAEYTAYDQPNPRVQSPGTMSEPQIIIEGGSHEWDLPGLFPNETTADLPPQVVKDVHQREVEIFKVWLEEWKRAYSSASADTESRTIYQQILN